MTRNTILVAALAAACPAFAAPLCAWADPGANRFTGDTRAAVMSYLQIPEFERVELADMVRRHEYTDHVTITATSIGDGRYTSMRDMHFGAASKCRGEVDRSMWPAEQVTRGLVYCVRGHCVIVPSDCSNVSLVNKVGDPPSAYRPGPLPWVYQLPDPVQSWVWVLLSDASKRDFEAKAAAAAGRRIDAVNEVPEPGTWALLAIAAVAGVVARKGRP